MKVHCREDYHFSRIIPIQEAVRESVNQTTADIEPNDRPSSWGMGNLTDSGIDLVQEVAAETRSLQLVVARRVKQLELGRAKKTDWLHRIADRASRRTSAASRAGMPPVPYSL